MKHLDRPPSKYSRRFPSKNQGDDTVQTIKNHLGKFSGAAV